jgi:hypothetical protein
MIKHIEEAKALLEGAAENIRQANDLITRSKQMPEVVIIKRITQIVIDGENFGYIINISKAHNGYDECYHIEWGDTLAGPEQEEVFVTLPLALLRAAALTECIKNDAYFSEDFGAFVELGTKFISDVTQSLKN